MIFPTPSPNDRLVQALAACRRHFKYAALFSALLNMLFIVPTLYMLQVYDRVVPTQGKLTLLFLTFVLVGGLMTLSMLDYVRSRVLVRASARLDRELAGAIVQATLTRPEGGLQRTSRQAVREFDTLRQALTGTGIIALLDAPWTPFYVLICFIIHPLVGMLATCGASLLVFLAWRNERATSQPLQMANEAAAKAYTSHEFSAAAADVVRALGMRDAMVRRHLDERQEMLALQARASFISSGLAALSKLVRLVLQSMALGLGALLVINHQISPGAIFASMFMVGRALAPIDQVIGAWKGIVQARGAYRTLSELFRQSPTDVAMTQLPAPCGHLGVERITVASPGRETAILQDICFEAQPGEVIGIVGPSGAGKSTLVRILAGAGMATSGAIRFDGADQLDWNSERLARHVGYMAQDAALFAGTVKDNISRFRAAMGEEQDQEAIDAAAVEAAQLAGAHDLILRLPSGYDYQLGWGGRGLSAGQAQRIAFARALFGSPRYLILDEPNSHLDSEGDVQLVSTLGGLKEEGTTILVVAHKLSILPVIDKILVLAEGKVKMFGGREEVLRRLALPQAPHAVPQRAAGG